MQGKNQQFRQAVNDLLTWSAEEGQRLPMNEAVIANLEQQGLIVDLVTGEVTTDPDAPANTRNLSPFSNIPYAGVVYAD